MKCPYCAGDIEAGVRKCRHCSEWLRPREFRWTFWLVVIFVVPLLVNAVVWGLGAIIR